MLEFADFVEGEVASVGTGYVVLLAGCGIGFKIKVLPELSQKLKVGQKLRLFLAVYGEHSPQLCGFLREKERDLFLLLAGVKGVGSATGMRLLALGSDKVQKAIESGEPEVLCEVKGVSQKLAEKIIFELKGKLVKVDNSALQALVNLGLEREEAKELLSSLPSSLSVEDKVKEALKRRTQQCS